MPREKIVETGRVGVVVDLEYRVVERLLVVVRLLDDRLDDSRSPRGLLRVRVSVSVSMHA